MDEDWDLENVPMVWDDCFDNGNYDGLFQGDSGDLIKAIGSEGIKGAGAEVINIGIGSSNDKRYDFVNHKENSDGVVGQAGSVSGKTLTQPDVIGSWSPNGILKGILAKPQSQDNDNCKRPDVVRNKKRKQVFFSDKLLIDLEEKTSFDEFDLKEQDHPNGVVEKRRRGRKPKFIMPQLDLSNVQTERSSDRECSPPPVLSPEMPVVSNCKSLTISPERGDESAPEFLEYFNNQERTVWLERFYYAELPGNLYTSSQEFSKYTNKCPLCNKCCTSTAEIYGHLHHHIVDSGKRASVISWCPHCLESVTPNQMKSHIKTNHHMAKGSLLNCQICELRLSTEYDLAVHMWHSHCRWDMPYNCRLCDYRSSQRYQVIDHFYKVHADTPNVICPTCLKTLPVGSELDMTQLLAHVQLHHLVSGQKCPNCSLVFIDMKEMNAHLKNGAHTSKQHNNITRDILTYSNRYHLKPLRIPEPPKEFLDKSAGVKYQQRKPYRIMASNVSQLTLNVDGEICIECGLNMKSTMHFPGVMSCSKCAYITCCKASMTIHCNALHRKGDNRYNKPVLQPRINRRLTDNCRCGCGFQNSSANKLAQHLVSCRKSMVVLC